MDFFLNTATDVWGYIRRDYREYPLRFFAELFSWVCSVISAVIFAVTVPTIPVIPLYTIFISGCCAAAWTCWSRGSFGLLANYVFLIVIDCIGLGRMLINH